MAVQCKAWTGQLPDEHERCVLDEGHDGDHFWEAEAQRHHLYEQWPDQPKQCTARNVTHRCVGVLDHKGAHDYRQPYDLADYVNEAI